MQISNDTTCIQCSTTNFYDIIKASVCRGRINFKWVEYDLYKIWVRDQNTFLNLYVWWLDANSWCKYMEFHQYKQHLMERMVYGNSCLSKNSGNLSDTIKLKDHYFVMFLTSCENKFYPFSWTDGRILPIFNQLLISCSDRNEYLFVRFACSDRLFHINFLWIR